MCPSNSILVGIRAFLPPTRPPGDETPRDAVRALTAVPSAPPPSTAPTMSDEPSQPIRRIETLVLVAIGGYAGSNLRYLVGDLVTGAGGTLLVNVLGSFALGFLLYEARYSAVVSQRTHVVVGTGFLSSVTTYSTFALESVRFGLAGAGYVVASYALGFGAVLVGRHLALLVDGGGSR